MAQELGFRAGSSPYETKRASEVERDVAIALSEADGMGAFYGQPGFENWTHYLVAAKAFIAVQAVLDKHKALNQ